MKKLVFLGFLVIVLAFLPCCKKNPHRPDIEEVLKVKIEYFNVDKKNIDLGEKINFSWKIKNGTSTTRAAIYPEIGKVALKGTREHSPTETTTYTLSVKDSNGKILDSRSHTVTVAQPDPEAPVIKHFTANPTQIMLGETSILSWEVENADEVTIDNGIGTVSLSGTYEVNPLETTVYMLTASNEDGEVLDSLEIIVIFPEDPLKVIAGPTFDSWISGRVLRCYVTVKNDSQVSVYAVKVEVILYDKMGIEIGRAWAKWYNDQGPVNEEKPEMAPGEEVMWRALWMDENQFLQDIMIRGEGTASIKFQFIF